MTRLLVVGLGGFVGSILRYWLSGVTQAWAPRTAFPLGTLVVNILGCFAVGLLAQLVEARGYLGPETRALVFVGLLGGFTTFSAFANETVTAARDGALASAAANVLGTVLLCLGAAWAGRVAAHLLWR
jgi:CrcB protein